MRNSPPPPLAREEGANPAQLEMYTPTRMLPQLGLHRVISFYHRRHGHDKTPKCQLKDLVRASIVQASRQTPMFTSTPQTRAEMIQYLERALLEKRTTSLLELKHHSPSSCWSVAMIEQYLEFDPVYQQLQRQIQWFHRLIPLFL